MSGKILLVITNDHNRPYTSPELLESVSGVVVNKKEQCADWVECADHVYAYGDISELDPPNRPHAAFTDVEKTVGKMLSNAHTHYILDRRRAFSRRIRRDYFKNTFNYVPFVCECLARCVDILDATQPRIVCFTSTPHDLESWALFHAACANEVAVAAVAESALPWRARVRNITPHRVYGYKETNELSIQRDWGEGGLSGRARDYIQRKRGKYHAAQPAYMVRQKQQRGRRSTKKLLSVLTGKTPFSLDGLIDYGYRALTTRSLQKTLGAVMTRELPRGPFIAMFLHYQPERTSIPEGGAYASQWIAIHKLLGTMPPEWRLVVKEHPSTFLLDMTRPFRHPDFYRGLAENPRVSLLTPQIDSFEVMDRAEAVVTLTGRVGFEAICRGVPAVVLGDAAYKYAPGVIDWSTSRGEALDIVTAVENATSRLRYEGIEDYLLGVERSTVAECRPGDFGALEHDEMLSRATMTRAVALAGHLA